MSARCPEGHLSHDADYCDQCGVRIVGVPEPYGYRGEEHPGRGVPQSAPSQPYDDGYGRRGYGDPAGPPDPAATRRAPADARNAADPTRGQAERPTRSGGYSGYSRDGYAEDRPTPTPGVPEGYGEQPYGRESAPRGRRDYPPDDAYGGGGETLSRSREGRGGYGRDGRDGYGRDDAPDRSAQRNTDPYRYGGSSPEPAAPRHAPSPQAPGAPDAGGRYSPCPNCRTPHEPGARYCEICGMDFATGRPSAAAGAAPAVPRLPTDDRQAGYPEDRGLGAAYGEDRGVGGYDDDRGGYGDARRGAGRSQNWETAGVAAWEAVVEAERDYYDSGDDHRVPFPSFYPRRVFALDGPRLLVGRRSESRGIHPDIDLSGAPEDPGISRAHAMFEQLPDGAYAVLDPGSTNGTRLNDEPEPIEPGQPVPLRDGDRVYLGAWTRITLRAR